MFSPVPAHTVHTVHAAPAITVNQRLHNSHHHFICICSWLLKLLSPAAVPDSKSCTVAIIKPDAVAHGKANEIIMKVREGRLLLRERRWEIGANVSKNPTADVHPASWHNFPSRPQAQDGGFEILVRGERTLTEEEARDFYLHKAAEVRTQWGMKR